MHRCLLSRKTSVTCSFCGVDSPAPVCHAPLLQLDAVVRQLCIGVCRQEKTVLHVHGTCKPSLEGSEIVLLHSGRQGVQHAIVGPVTCT